MFSTDGRSTKCLQGYAAQVSAAGDFPDQDQLLFSLLWFDYLQGKATHSFRKQSKKDNLARILSAL